MAKLTLLELVKDILNDMDSDEVNSINDTVESQQVAQIVKTCYFEMIANRNWPHLKKLIQIDASGDISKPNYLKLPTGTKELVFIKYDTATLAQPNTRLVELIYKEPDAFLRMISSRNSDLPYVQTVIDFSGSKLLITNNTPPQYWTSFDDTYIITDSYDVGVDTTLQKTKTQALAYIDPLWSHADDFIPDLPSEAFPALNEEAKSTASIVLKQMANQKAEQKAGRQQKWLARKAWAAKGGITYPNYGRSGRK
jgi:hypothetical protein